MPTRIVAAEIANSFAILLSFLVLIRLILFMMNLLFCVLMVSAWPGCGYVKRAQSLIGRTLGQMGYIVEVYSSAYVRR